MAEPDILNAFNDCIDRLNIGQSVNDCLRDYPRQAAAIRPMIEVGKQVQSLQAAALEVAQAQARVRYRFEAALDTPHPRRRASYPISRFAGLAAAILVIAFVISAGTTLASQSAIPGDPLYGLKRFTEQVETSLSNDPSLATQLNQRRIDETRQLLSANRAATIAFQGTITTQNGSLWVIGGLPIQVLASTQGADKVRIGDLVAIEGYTTLQSQLFATSIRLLGTTTQPLPTIVPTLVQTTVPTITQPTLTPTRIPSPTSTLMPTKTIAPTQAQFMVTSVPPTHIVPNPAPTITNAGNDSHGGDDNTAATDDHGGQHGGGDNSGPGSSNSGSGSNDSGSGDSHGGGGSSGHGGG